MKRLVACLLGMSIAATAVAADPRIGKLVRYDAGDFTIYTSRSGVQAREFMTELAKFRVTLEKTLGKRSTPNHSPTRILIVSAGDFDRYLQPREKLAGFFQPAMFENHIAMNGDVDRGFSVPLIFHEYTHYFLSSQFAGEYPPWFNEGLAELMGYTKFTKTGTAILQIPMYRVHEARDGDWIPFDRMIRVDHHSPEYVSHSLRSSFYAQAWLTVHYGLVENREFGAQIFSYLKALNRLVPQAEAEREFGPDLAAADAKLREYSRNTNMSSGSITLGEVPAFTLPPGKPVSDNDAYAVYIDLMLDTRSLGPARVRPFVEALARREPGSARSAIYEARLAAREEDTAAFARAVDAAEKALVEGDWESRRDLGAVLLANSMEWNPLQDRSATDTERDLKRAFSLYAQAVAHNNADIEALWGFGTAATRLNQNLDLAEQALIAAYQRAPSSPMIAMSLANLKGRASEPDGMIPYLKDTIRYASDLGMRRWAVDTLTQMEKYIAQRDAANAAYEKEVAEWEKKYGKAKTGKKTK